MKHLKNNEVKKRARRVRRKTRRYLKSIPKISGIIKGVIAIYAPLGALSVYVTSNKTGAFAHVIYISGVVMLGVVIAVLIPALVVVTKLLLHNPIHQRARRIRRVRQQAKTSNASVETLAEMN